MESYQKLGIMPVIANNMDRIEALHEAQLAFDEVDRLLFSAFKSALQMVGQGPTHGSNTSRTFRDMLDRFDPTNGYLLGITTDYSFFNSSMTRELQSTLEASGIEWPALRNYIP
jgi:hypothetical protein